MGGAHPCSGSTIVLVGVVGAGEGVSLPLLPTSLLLEEEGEEDMGSAKRRKKKHWGWGGGEGARVRHR